MRAGKVGAFVIVQQEKNQLRRYLLGQLAEADEEAVELRLLTDADYAEELDLLVDELTYEYASGVVSAEERGQFERRFFESEERREKLRFALALKKSVAEHEARRRRRNRILRYYLPVAASLLLAVGLGVVARRAFFGNSEVDEGLAALRTSFRERRPVEVRIPDLPYAPAEPLRGPVKGEPLQLRLAASLLLKAVAERPNAYSHRALGEYYLATREFDLAVEHLRAALALDAKDARAHGDLGAALLERGKILGEEAGRGGESMRDFGESLDHLNKALELDPDRLEALFNRALLNERMGVIEAAKDDWRAYLARDPDSEWAKEASDNLKALDEQQRLTSADEGQALRDFMSAYERGDEQGCLEILGRNYTSAGNSITNMLLDSHLDATTRGGGRVELEALEYIGRLASRRAGDNSTADLVGFYRRASPRQRAALARARRQVKTGYERLMRGEMSAALSELGQAKTAFDEAGDEYESALAEYLTGVCHLFRLDLVNADHALGRVLAFSEGRKYEWLRGQSLYRLAMQRQSESKYSEAVENARRAEELLERVDDVNSVIKVLIHLADEYEYLNDATQALSFLQRGLTLARKSNPKPSEVWGMHTAMGLNFNSLGLTAAALAHQKEALRIAKTQGGPVYVARSHAYIGVTYGNLQRYDEALGHIGLAQEEGNKLPDETGGQEIMANASLYAGEIYRRRGDHDRAIESYDRAINFYAGLKFPFFRYTAHRGRLLSLLARGNDPSAEQELRTVLDIFEQYRGNLTEAGQRNTFFDVEQGVYDRVINLAHARKKDSELAFDYSELSRARSLLAEMRRRAQAGAGDERPVTGAAPLLLSEVRRRMPADAQILQYAVLDDKILAWLVTRTEVWTEEIPVDSRALEEKVGALLRAINDPDGGGETERLTGELHDLLVARFESRLDPSKLLCVVPDKALHRVPFAALNSGKTGKHLFESYRLVTAPSSTVFIECCERARSMAGSRDATAPSAERLLSVGNPDFDRRAFPALDTLASAGAEAKGVAAFYSQPSLLLGGGAREKAVRDEITKSDVANFALHYVADERSDMQSGMALAGRRDGAPRDDDGFWQVFEIYQTEMPRTRLVVLSACQTGFERNYRGEGAVNLAHPFIAAGVPVVLASLWPVDSGSTARLMVSFHRHRTVERKPTLEALRLAQQELRGDERYRHPRHWAAFITIGGAADF